MAVFRIISTIAWETGLPEDVTVNTFHVQAATTPDSTTLAGHWKDFQDDIAGAYGPVVAQTGHTLRCYNLADPEPRAPLWEVGWAFTSAPTGTQLPPEVALCISYQGVKVSGTPQRRRRGRMYVGPMNAANFTNGVPSTTLIDSLGDAFQTFKWSMDDSSMPFVVWSRLDEGAVSLVEAWIDNAADTMRSRGFQPTTRDKWDLTQP